MFIISFIISVILGTVSIHFAAIAIGEKTNIKLIAVIALLMSIIGAIIGGGLIGSILGSIIGIILLMKIGQFELISAISVSIVASIINFLFFIVMSKFF